jgi:glycosyltransferase involved in cell wall biosynthesis
MRITNRQNEQTQVFIYHSNVWWPHDGPKESLSVGDFLCGELVHMKGQKLPLVSIITPIYNEEIHLAECIESVEAQTYHDWEYIIVDNCSTDGSAQIAREYAKKDRRIKVIQNSRCLRALPNHNFALSQISNDSKYCKIVFADDWIFPECLERMVALAEEYPSIGLIGAYVLEGQKVTCTGLPYEVHVMGGREICRRHFLNNLYVFGSPNSLLYRADLVRNASPFFSETNIHADTEACFAALKNSDFGFVHQILTFTRVRSESRTTVSSDLQTHFAGMLQLLMAHGRSYLTTDELKDLLKNHFCEYYKFIGKSMLIGHKKVLAYHKRKLIEAGVGFSWLRVILGALATLGSLALNPKTTTQKLLTNDENPFTRRIKGHVIGPTAEAE